MRNIFICILSLSCALLVSSCGIKNHEHQAVSAPDGVVDGQAIFQKNCVLCHGSNGKMGLNGAKDLTASMLTAEERISVITNGRNTMASYKAILSPEEIKAVAEYTMTLK